MIVLAVEGIVAWWSLRDSAGSIESGVVAKEAETSWMSWQQQCGRLNIWLPHITVITTLHLVAAITSDLRTSDDCMYT
jgi:hypothetical protein